MKVFNQDGKRLFHIETDNENIPDVQVWSKNHKSCLFCEHCDTCLDSTDGKNLKVVSRCQLPSASPNGNCLLHCMNKTHSCSAFKDIDGDTEGVVLIKKDKQEVKNPDIASFNISKKGVEQK